MNETKSNRPRAKTDDTTAARLPAKTNWDIVRAQFRKHRTAVWAFRCLIGLSFLAVFAPVVATSSPFVLKTVEGGLEFPWFRDLLNQNVFPSGVDLFFNLLLIFTPFVAMGWLLFRRHTRSVLAVFVILFTWCFVSITASDDARESQVGNIALAPQHLLYIQEEKRDYLELRQYELDQVLAAQRAPRYEKRADSARLLRDDFATQLEAPNLDAAQRGNLEAKLMAAESKLKQAQRKKDSWDARKETALQQSLLPENKIFALMPPIGFHHDDNDEERVVEAPTFAGWGNSHILGTDSNGRDVFSRILFGTRVSLTIGVIAVAIYATIGTILGSLMGFFGGWIDMALMRLVEIMICFPTFAFVLIVVAILGKSIFFVMLAIGLVGWTGVARLIRGQFLAERGQEYVLAAQALGIPRWRIVFRHVLPNAIHPLFVAATFGVASAILVESGLAFLGLGDPKVPSWGQLLLEGRTTAKNWLILSPGVAIFFTVTILNLVGEGLRDALDPKLRQ